MANYNSLRKVSQASSLRLVAHTHREPKGNGTGAATAPLEQAGEKEAVPEDGREAERVWHALF